MSSTVYTTKGLPITVVPMPTKRRFTNLSDRTFDRLLVKSYVGIRVCKCKTVLHYWLCECVCGNTLYVCSSGLLRKNTRSCGCLHDECIVARSTRHGCSPRRNVSREYRAWAHMRGRCMNPDDHNYDDYGGRNISICSRWRDFSNFLSDMGPCPPGYTLHRVNNDGNYKKSNCRWTDMKTQLRNKRTNVVLTYKGRTQCLSAWTEELNLPYTTVQARLQVLGWSVPEAFETPVGSRRRSS